MIRSLRGRIVAALAVMASLAVGAVAMAAGDDRAAAESALKEVDASPRKDVASDFASRSRAALDRAARLRASGDESHAKVADNLARQWAEAARDVARAAVVEGNAQAARLGATDAGAIADRERALLEEAIAQSGRLRAQMESVERDGKDQPARTSTAASDAGAHPPAKTAPAAKDGGAPSTPPSSAPPKAPKTNAADGGAR
jgi:hypothetical protein